MGLAPMQCILICMLVLATLPLFWRSTALQKGWLIPVLEDAEKEQKPAWSIDMGLMDGTAKRRLHASVRLQGFIIDHRKGSKKGALQSAEVYKPGSGKAGRVAHSLRPNAEHRGATRKIFERIYATTSWAKTGATLGQAAQQVPGVAAEVLRAVVNEHHLGGMVDAPCGATTWMPKALRNINEDQPGFRYLGIDAVQDVVAANTAKLVGQGRPWRFRVQDFISDSIPDGYDLIFCRDALQHLPFASIIDALENFANSTAKYLLAGSYLDHPPERNPNVDLGATGESAFLIDLTAAPFLLRHPLHSYNEHTSEVSTQPDKFLLLYTVEYLGAQDFAAMRARATT